MKRIATIGAMKLSLYLKNRVEEETISKYSRILDMGVTEKDIKNADNDKIFKTKNVPEERKYSLMKSCGGDEVARTLVQLAALRYIYPESGDLLEIVAKGCGDGVTIEAAAKVSGMQGEITDDDNLSKLLMVYDAMELLFLSEEETSDYLRIPLKFDIRLVSWLTADDFPDMDLLINEAETYVPVEKPCVFGFEDEMTEAADTLLRYAKMFEKNLSKYQKELPLPVKIIISGEKESGRMTMAQMMAWKCKFPMYAIDFDIIRLSKQPRKLVRKLVRECMLMDAVLCIKNIAKSEVVKEIVTRLSSEYSKLDARPIIFLCEPDVKCEPYLKGDVLNFSIGKCKPHQSLQLWEGFLKDKTYREKIDCRELTSKMVLTAGQIKKIVKTIDSMVMSSEDDSFVDNKMVYKACYRVLDDGRYENIKRVESGFTLADLKIEPRNKQLLTEICNQIKYRQKVFDDWNLGKKFTYGRCVSVLLVGPPGTGKTMAVHALSSELGLELYKVDLSQLVDKYIGETEKRLEEVFTRAEKSNMILFFDEADAVLGKRNEVKDSHDKYANTEIAYILQRIEEYDGIVILATNYLQNIDTAFMRRIRYVVSFEIPSRDMRKEIWLSAFPAEVPLSRDIDFDFLAEKFEMAGGNIKNIVLNAVFLAAADGSEVAMKHVMQAVYRENSKDKRVSFTSDYGEYSYLLHI
ncbi:MAG: ATP-binding protein [Clostridia bacterium]|nr:ATP-binding protein [Clostridia bacterium]